MTLNQRPFSFLLLIALSLLLLITAGCKTRRFPTEQAPELHINWARETPESLLKSMRHRAQGLATFTAYFQINMDPPPAKMPSSFSGIIYLSKDGENTRLRIKAFHLFGATLFDMVAQEGVTKVYIPSKQTLYVGKTDKKQQEAAQGPQEIFSSLMINFNDLKILPGSSLIIGKDTVKLPLIDGEMRFDKKTGHILSLIEPDKKTIYSDYQKLAPNYPAMPTDIQLTSSLGKARCRLKEITIYQTMGQENFDLSSYQVKKIKALSEAGKE
ncbi:MAG: hypothetical protein ABFS09_04910 [Thermodesulfobacteriota bacterium]